ncbi:MAG TPA: glycosyltransferase 87 family protein [Candidatus Acidoferrales bacterium]|nr:glycosyltransferase 87 family protein [Candidatus Acidoferrales bacterium]
MLTRAATFVLLGAGLVLLFFSLDFVVRHPQGTLDFANLYTGATILRQGHIRQLYDLGYQERIERQFIGDGHFLLFEHPPFEAWLYLPFAYLSYRRAFVAWAAFNLCLLGLIFYLIRFTGYRLGDASRYVWLAVCFPLVAGNLALGQDALLLALVFLLAYLALKQRREFASGLLLGLGLFRFEITLPFVAIFFLRRRWRLLLGFSIMCLLALGCSVTMIGWSGIEQYARIILAASRTGGSAESADVGAMPSLRGALVTLAGGAMPAPYLFSVVLAGSLLLLGLAAAQFTSVARPEARAFDLEFSLSVVATLLASYHLFSQVTTPLILAAFLVLGYEDQAPPGVPWADRKGSLLFLLFTLVLIAGGIAHFREYSVLAVVLLGLYVWLGREISRLHKGRAPA